MKETFVVVIANLIVAAMRAFDIIQGLTGGGSNNATQILLTYICIRKPSNTVTSGREPRSRVL